ncbi:phosphodiesterase [Ferrimonas sp. SCSIO 43195]|uniref:phosphodiesterase n=1 Tax=Ferrimonas sp. SCSIO 43195 TaxID=2822844 RepID=UPI002075D36F|nr:phosphodiesterase [Ferrimonas sp. SCSIO 43195]USD39170.1 phosphodiesterase [Ferrimonas sp. SCSIO 43195]
MLFISDIHGCLPALERALEWAQRKSCRHLILLGDVLNHGPRNPVPEGYNPPAVAERLNQWADRILAVRGNCDSEVDQMLCQFPLMADYNNLMLGSKRAFVTHGHLWNDSQLPPLADGDLFCFGHSHIPMARWQEKRLMFNPGSITLPKGGFAPSLGHFDGKLLTVMDLDGNVIEQASIDEF